MAPLTRSRARQPGNVPSPLNASYYVQRASAALIVTEATQVSQQGQGYAWTPGIHSPEQVEGWRLVADAVHSARGRLFMQLWHVGRISHPSLQPDGMLPVAPSAIRPAGQAFIENDKGEGDFADFVTPRALQTEEMPYLVQQFVRAARNALAAGMDGVEIHAANGYLLDQFICSKTNRRTDQLRRPGREPRAAADGDRRGGEARSAAATGSACASRRSAPSTTSPTTTRGHLRPRRRAAGRLRAGLPARRQSGGRRAGEGQGTRRRLDAPCST